jgi:hypothetical protein
LFFSNEEEGYNAWDFVLSSGGPFVSGIVAIQISFFFYFEKLTNNRFEVSYKWTAGLMKIA